MNLYRSLRVPHQGSLCRVEDGSEHKYVIEIKVHNDNDEGEGNHELRYTRNDFEFAQRLFAILDHESRGYVDRTAVKEFVTLRCPVFWRRDDDLRSLNLLSSLDVASPTFDEIWKSVIVCSRGQKISSSNENFVELGVEGWIVFCRFIALAQYLEAKRRFLARHLQQTMRHRNSPRGSEMVVVDVPPPEAPAPLSPEQLAGYEIKCKAPLPLPELDLDHSLVAAHDAIRRRPISTTNHGEVKICLFGPSSFSSSLLNSTTSSSNSSGANLEFAVTSSRLLLSVDASSRGAGASEEVVVRRSMADMKWLDDTFTSHKILGGTLCGRILPPFPGTCHFLQRDSESVINSSLKSTGGAITAAAASVGLLRDVAKSFFGSYISRSSAANEDSLPAPVPQVKKKTSKKSHIVRALPESYYRPNSPSSKARQLERYLNYLLEHPALSTSFPLNVILKASQSGLEAAKESLEECTRATTELKAHAPQLDDGRATIPFWPPSVGGDASASPNFAWVRTAAQAAMALKVHGMLETTGMNSASARLQHASLPAFGTSARSAGWDDDECVTRRDIISVECEDILSETETSNFEDGVVSIRSELHSDEPQPGDDGYDLLPLPVPAPERRILSAGSDPSAAVVQRGERFHYGTTVIPNRIQEDEEDTTREAYLGDISVDENIDKLREVIGSVDNTLSRCLASIAAIGNAQRERQALHLSVVRGLDSWAGMRGRFVSQRSLLKGVAGLSQSKEIYEEGDVSLIDDISWQTSLAHSAVAAAEDVRSAVRASRTAANAKAAASSAAFAAQSACDAGQFASIDEARAARTRASIAQSHAIHAAVVEHESKTVKRRATLALANDVKCWNVHRKREMLQSCMSYARSQHEATRRAVDAWSSLRDGFIGTSMIPAHERRQAPSPAPISEPRRLSVPDLNEVTATIYSSPTTSVGGIVAVDHNILSTRPTPTIAGDSTDQSSKEAATFDMEIGLPFAMAVAAPIPEEDEEEDVLPEGTPADTRRLLGHSFNFNRDQSGEKTEEQMSASMQSLVDGLMNWGGGFEAEEDHFALPIGMAASIALEESITVGASKMTT